MNAPSSSAADGPTQTLPTKLVSLLALAGGAAAMPQAAQADIIFTDLTSNPGVVNYTTQPFLFSVPGTAQVGFFGVQQTITTTFVSSTFRYRSVLAGMVNSNGVNAGAGGNVGGFVEHLPFGASWDQPADVFYNVPIATAGQFGVPTPNTGYSNRYLAWVFEDSTQGNALRYGWAEYNLSVAGYNAGGPTVTILRYAYDDSGVKPTMGQLPVPEPSTGALVVMGAMALGARGVRKWRQNRSSVNQA